ncbi:MAG: 4Fe-4S binding protein [Treponema sp.]|nr:4Fe-4S binding protein [Treponema sp.]
MVRQIIKIDREKCNGCGLCVSACHEGAIGMKDGKATLLRDDYCDGLGNCLPVCPTGAITFENRDALEYNEMEVQKKMEQEKHEDHGTLACGCPGSQSRVIDRAETAPAAQAGYTQSAAAPVRPESQLRQWPIQIKLAPVNAPYFNNANILVSADCAAYAYGNFHNDFMKNKITLIGCPKLDDIDYSEKLTAIIKSNNIKSVTIVRMEVPCCGGLENAVKTALKDSGKMIPWQVTTISTDGKILVE